jgi:SpoVK/Ycf46/Vps4 family AAA+-type ATPase
LARQIAAGKQQRTFVVTLAPVVQIPLELEKLFVVLQHELPGREQLAQIARGIATEERELPAGPELERVLDAASGLTRLLRSRAPTIHAPCPRGVLLLGVPGTGKSAFCKALGNETGRPTLVLDVGSLMGSLVGQTEERTRQALQIVDAMAPCVLMIDEVEKALAGVGGSGQTDSGISARLFGAVLSWLNDHRSDVFVVCTANDVSRLPPEFSRAERFDGVFFLDLPSREQKDQIWQQYVRSFHLEAPQRRPADEQWTGAEIKSCCRLAALLDVPLMQAAQNVVPIATTALESVERLRTWASGRCLAADRAGLYQREESAASGARRRVSRTRPSSADN